MDYVNLGKSGVKVSRVCMGCMTLGREADEAESIRMIDIAFAHGVNFFDTANSYAKGRSEEILGKTLQGKRNKVVLATKVFNPVGDSPNERGCSRYHIVRAVEDSLRRLKTDRIDLYQLHRFDSGVPLEETLRTLDDLVRWGKVVYIGCSNFTDRQLKRALGISKDMGLHSFISVQPMYNILMRDVEKDLLPFCLKERIGVIPFNPLAGGFLTGKYKAETKPPIGTRLDDLTVYRDRYWSEENFQRTARFLECAKKRKVHPIGLSIAWVASHPGVTSPIIGARNESQLKETLKVADVQISGAERDVITKEVYGCH